MLNRFSFAAAAALFVAAPVAAAPVAAPTPPQGRALILIPLTLTKVQDLHFGTVVAHQSTAITVFIDPFTGARSSSHPAQMFPTDIGQRGLFAGAGTPGRPVVMALTPPTTLDDGLGNSLTVVTLFMDGPPTRFIAPDKTFFVGIGGVIQVPANAPDGLYSQEYDLTADYQ